MPPNKGVKNIASFFHNTEEYNRWLTKWHDHALDLDILVAKTAATALEHCNKDFYPNVHKLLSLLCTLPITTCECERSFSRLRVLKNYLRSTMGEDRLVGLALMLVHRNVPEDVEEVVDTFAARFRTSMKLLPRRMLSAE
ncbi:52 kDa repressor of the inhibitor of the protein kinase-like [Littorina saxatilis]|uniref:52 kDa repressor of the inhibitor of the protein kinase-like n=1 Tax=Littorina saxatilis TaxID=31220 RepID=UPI0038B4235C